MKPAPLLAILLVSALGLGQRSLRNSEKFEVSDLSASDSPISFTGTTKILKTGTACVVTAHNNSTQSLLAVRATANAATRYTSDQPIEFRYDGFFKESLITPGLDFDVVDEGMYSGGKPLTLMAFQLSHRPRILSAMPRSRWSLFSSKRGPSEVTTRPRTMSWQGGRRTWPYSPIWSRLTTPVGRLHSTLS
jgi:hypothetical protein